MDIREGEVIEPREPAEEESLADLREHYDIELCGRPTRGR